MSATTGDAPGGSEEAAFADWLEHRDPERLQRLFPEACRAVLEAAEASAVLRRAGRPDPAVWTDIPGYQVIRRIGGGGMGVVFEAVQANIGRRVAVKLMHAARAAEPSDRARFAREARALGRIRHPGVVTILDAGEAGAVPWIAMEFVDGVSLAEQIRCAREGRTDGLPTSYAERWPVVVTAFASLAEALAEVHRNGIVHRDIKPSNILVERSGAFRLADFGIALVGDEEPLTRSGPVGTPTMMAPEQLRDDHEAFGPATDIYALGLTLYEALTLNPAYSGTHAGDVVARVLRGDHPAPRHFIPEMAPPLEAVVLKCAAYDPGARYVSASALADDLRRLASGQVPLAGHPTLATRARAFVRRRPRSVAIAAFLVLLAAALALGGTVADQRRRLDHLDRVAAARRILIRSMTADFEADVPPGIQAAALAESERLAAADDDDPFVRTVSALVLGRLDRTDELRARLRAIPTERRTNIERILLAAVTPASRESARELAAVAIAPRPTGALESFLLAFALSSTADPRVRDLAGQSLQDPEIETPLRARAHYIRGLANMRAGDLAAAEPDLVTATTMSPEDVRYAAGLCGLLHARRNDAADAKACSDLARLVDSAPARRRIAMSGLLAAGHPRAAEELADAAPPEERHGRAWTLARMKLAAERPPETVTRDLALQAVHDFPGDGEIELTAARVVGGCWRDWAEAERLTRAAASHRTFLAVVWREAGNWLRGSTTASLASWLDAQFAAAGGALDDDFTLAAHALAGGRPDEAKRLLQTLAETPAFSVSAHLQLARIAAATGDVATMRGEARAAAALAPWDPSIIGLLADAMRASEGAEAAFATYQTAIEHGLLHTRVLTAAASMAAAAGRRDESNRLYEAAVREAPASAQTWYRWAADRAAAGESDEAVAAFRHGLGLVCNDTFALLASVGPILELGSAEDRDRLLGHLHAEVVRNRSFPAILQDVEQAIARCSEAAENSH